MSSTLIAKREKDKISVSEEGKKRVQFCKFVLGIGNIKMCKEKI